jgi:hypothetical protein
MHQHSFYQGLSWFALRPAGRSRTTSHPRPPVGPAARPAAAASSACGPRAGRCTASSDQPGLLLAVELAAVLTIQRHAVHGGIQPAGGVLLAHPGHGGVVDLQRGGDRPSVRPGPASPWLALSRIRAWVRARAGRSPARSGCGAGHAPARIGRRRAACACSAPPAAGSSTATSMGRPHITQTTADDLLGYEVFAMWPSLDTFSDICNACSLCIITSRSSCISSRPFARLQATGL